MGSVMMCKNCMLKLGIQKTLDEGFEKHKRALEKLGKAALVEEILKDMHKKRNELLEPIKKNFVAQCYICKLKKDLSDGAMIADWSVFCDNVIDSLYEMRRIGKETGKNLIPYHQLVGTKIALKASKYIFVRGGGK